jgi:hypothetical protein
MQISRLETVPLRKSWPNETRDFTTWLAENLDFLGEALEMELSLVEQEAAAGPFSADILAEDESGNPVVIENQLKRTDHDHLGNLITYLSNLDAKAAVWIASEPRPEHEQAIHWLNEVLPADTAFYLVSGLSGQRRNRCCAPSHPAYGWCRGGFIAPGPVWRRSRPSTADTSVHGVCVE